MALFWHHIFACAYHKGEHTATLLAQNEMFRRNGLSDFRTILLDLSRDPCMIFWLDNNENHNGDPNENYGRELMELFSMGIGNYTEDDIKMAARAFTGWTFRQPMPLYPYGHFQSRFVYREDDHDHSVKKLSRPHRRLQRRGHHRHHRPAAGDRPLRVKAPLQLLRRRRGAGARVEHRPSTGPRCHQYAV